MAHPKTLSGFSCYGRELASKGGPAAFRPLVSEEPSVHFKQSPSRSTFSPAAVIVFIAAMGFTTSSLGQEPSGAIWVGNVQITGLLDDWTHHRLVFSNPGTEADPSATAAMTSGSGSSTTHATSCSS